MTTTVTSNQICCAEQAEVSDSNSPIATKFQEKLSLIHKCAATLSTSLKRIEEQNGKLKNYRVGVGDDVSVGVGDVVGVVFVGCCCCFLLLLLFIVFGLN